MRQIQMMPRRLDVSWRKPVSGLVLDLSMQDQSISSPLKDRSGNGNDGVITGATWEKLPGGLWYLSFAGGTDSVDCGTNASLRPATDVSAKVWARFDSISDTRAVLGYTTSAGVNGYSLYKFSTTLKFAINHFSSWFASATAEANVWHCFLGTFDRNGGADNIKLYDNGVLQTPGTLDAAIDYTDVTNLWLGRAGGGSMIDADLDLFEILGNRVVSAGEALSIYNQERHLFNV